MLASTQLVFDNDDDDGGDGDNKVNNVNDNSTSNNGTDSGPGNFYTVGHRMGRLPGSSEYKGKDYYLADLTSWRE